MFRDSVVYRAFFLWGITMVVVVLGTGLVVFCFRKFLLLYLIVFFCFVGCVFFGVVVCVVFFFVLLYLVLLWFVILCCLYL